MSIAYVLITHLRAKVELRRRPHLADVPAVIVDRSGGRPVVADRFPAAGRVPLGVPVEEALSLHAGAVVIEVDEPAYRAAFQRVLTALQGVSDRVEEAELGTAYVGLDGLQEMYGGEALVSRAGFFKAGISMYGISDLFALAATTHKFEAHYLDQLIGPLPQAASLYRERSPLFAAAAIRDPVAVFQGEIDPVVPKAQADAIVASLARRGVPHVYHVYAGEGHGWRKTETIAHFYGAVDAFLRQHVLFT